MHCLWCDQSIIPDITWSNFYIPQKEVKICQDCYGKLERINGPTCPKCGRSMLEDKVCVDCFRWEEGGWQGVLERNISVYHYNDFTKEVIAKWKYRGDYVLREVFQDNTQKVFKRFLKDNKINPVLVPIPLSEERFAERGFNQAFALADMLSLPIVEALSRMDSEKQSKKTRQERLNSVNPFQLTTPILKPIVLIDDIYTTGITLRHAAKILKDNGTPLVYSFTLVRG